MRGSHVTPMPFQKFADCIGPAKVSPPFTLKAGANFGNRALGVVGDRLRRDRVRRGRQELRGGRLNRSVTGDSFSTRSPRLIVSLRVTFQSSWKYDAVILVLDREAAAAGHAAARNAEQQGNQFAAHRRRRRVVQRPLAPQVC